MKLKGFWILFFLTLIAVGLSIYDIRWEKKKEEQKQITTRLLQMSPDEEIRKIILQKPGVSPIELRYQENAWRLMLPVEDVIDESQVIDFVNSLKVETYEKEVASGSNINFKIFGLDAIEKATQIRVELVKGETSREVVLVRGEQKNYAGKNYVRILGIDKVYLVDYKWDSLFDRTSFDLRNKRLLRAGIEDINEWIVKSKTREIALKKENDLWKSSKYPKYKIDTDKVKEFFLSVLNGNSILEFKKDGPVPKQELQAWGLHDPQIKMSLFFNQGKTEIIEFGKNKEGNYFARLINASRVVRISQADYKKVEELDWKVLRNRREIFNLPVASINKVYVRYGEKFIESEKRQDEWIKLASSAPDIRGEGGKINSLIDRLSVLTVEEFIEDLKVNNVGPTTEAMIEVWDEKGVSLGKWQFGKVKNFDVGNLKKNLLPVVTSRYEDPIFVAEADFNKLELSKLVEEVKISNDSSNKKEDSSTEKEIKK